MGQTETDRRDLENAARVEPVSLASGDDDDCPQKRCCATVRYGGNVEAKGYALGTVGRGGIIMSNIILSTALYRLASDAAGCDVDSAEECTTKVYGFRPSSLLTMIVVVGQILSTLLLPLVGAIVDYTPHRVRVGVLSAVFLTTVQAIQIWLTDATWFAMLVLQAINGFVYNVQSLAAMAYFPEIGLAVDNRTMISFAAGFTQMQATAQLLYLILNVGLQLALLDGDVMAAQVSQGICVAWMTLAFVPMWGRFLPPRPAARPCPAGRSLFGLGFGQVRRTCAGINRHYGGSLRWFFLAVCFSEAGANAFTVVAVTYMVEVLKANTTQVGIVFIITLTCMLPGAKLGEIISQRTNPITSWKVNAVIFSLVTLAGSFVLTGPDRLTIVYAFGMAWGIMLGWWYPLANVVFSLAVPPGQEAEMSGFYNYCRIIFTWVPPLIFMIMNESGVKMEWGMLHLCAYLLFGMALLFLMDPWKEVLKAAKVNRMMKDLHSRGAEDSALGH